MKLAYSLTIGKVISARYSCFSNIVCCRDNLEGFVKDGARIIRRAKFRKAPSREAALAWYAYAEAHDETAII
jgi:hypothetical protein